jgi:hypothetical protein
MVRFIEHVGGDDQVELAQVRRWIAPRRHLAIGMEADIASAAAIDSFSVVPRLDRASGWFVADR